MNEGPVNVIEDYLNRIIGGELQGSLIGSKGELISYFYEAPRLPFGQFYHIAGSGVPKERLESLSFEAKN